MSTKVTEPAWETRLGNASAKAVLVNIADAANHEGFGWPSIPTICERTELSKRQVLRILQVFQEIGLIERRPGEPRRYKYAFQIDRAMLGIDLAERFRSALLHAQRRADVMGSQVQKPVVRPGARDSETMFHFSEEAVSVPETLVEKPVICPGTSVSGTPKSVSETQKGVLRTQKGVLRTQKGVLRTLPPHPLYGGTVNEPSMNRKTPQPPDAGGGVESYVDQVMQGCGFTRRRLRRVLEDQMRLRLSAGECAPTVALAMIQAWKDQLLQADREVLRVHYGPDRFFGDAHWCHPEGWHWDTQKLEKQAQARVGMY